MKKTKLIFIPLLALLLSSCSFFDFFNGNVSISKASLELLENESDSLTITAPESSTITWNISNTDVAKLNKTTGSSIIVNAISEGTATITATVNADNKETVKTCSLSVYKGLSISKTSLILLEGNTDTLTATSPKNSTVSWSVSNSKTISLSSKTGPSVTVTALKEGSSTITAQTTFSGRTITKDCNVVVNKNITTLTISESSLTIVEGKTETITASAPLGATVSWTSSNPSVASLNKSTGLSVTVSAVEEGTATITASATINDQLVTRDCAVTVTKIQPVTKVDSTYTYKDYAKGTGYMSICPNKGSSRLLIVPVWFTDSSNYILESKKEVIRSDIETTYLGTESDTGWESVKTYYAKDSFNNVQIDGFVTSWYSCGKMSTYYYTDINRTVSLVNSAVSWYKSTYSVSDMKGFDKDSNGWIDGVMLIYAAPDYRSMNKDEDEAGNMWAYCFWTNDGTNNPSVSNPVPNVFFWASYDFMYSSEKARIQTGKSNYGGGDTNHCKLDAHTFIHEMGHVFGLEDYYSYGKNDESCPAGAFSMQDFNIGAHDPYSRIALGWVSPFVPTKTCTFTVGTIEESGEAVILAPNYTGSPFDEYIILELYTPTGLNQFDSTYSYNDRYPLGPSRVGVRVWHVDARLAVMEYKTNKWSFNGTITTNPTIADGSYTQVIEHATTNTNGTSSRTKNYAGSNSYNLLELIRNSTTEFNMINKLFFF